MARRQSDATNVPNHPAPLSTDPQLVQDVQDRLAHWVTSGTENQDLANAHDETLPLPILLFHLYRDLFHFYERRLGMSQSRVMLLHELMHTGEINQTELAQRLGIETALLTRFAKQMEASGLLSRRVDPRDNRFTLVTLTATGQQVFQQMMIFSREFEAQLVEGLSTDEQVSIRRALIHIQATFTHLKEPGSKAQPDSGATPTPAKDER